jgi:hypothetical protein
MRPSLAVLLALAAAPAGCLPAPGGAAAARAEALRPRGGEAGDVVEMDVAVLERPVGDRYVNEELWELVDEQALDLERKPALEDNGFRVGQVGGLPPAGLQALLTSERSCVDPRRHRLRSGTPVSVALGPAWKRCRYSLREGGRETPVDLSGAACTLEIVPTLTADGRTTLHFTPVVKHGQARVQPMAVQDPSGEHRWDVRSRQPTESYAWLSWEVTVAPNEYVVVGTRLGQDGTLGHRFFLGTEPGAKAQRLLVIRTGRPPPAREGDEGSFRLAPPLAHQAGKSSARGNMP